MATYNIEDIGGKANARYFKKMEDVALDYCPYQIPSEAWKSFQIYIFIQLKHKTNLSVFG